MKLYVLLIFFVICLPSILATNFCGRHEQALRDFVDKLEEAGSKLHEIDRTLDRICVLLDESDQPVTQSESTESLNETLHQLNLFSIAYITPWVATIFITSPHIKILQKGSRFFVTPLTDCDYCFEVFPGDHNLWFDKNGDLWGYERCGKIFHRIDNDRILLKDLDQNWSYDKN